MEGGWQAFRAQLRVPDQDPYQVLLEAFSAELKPEAVQDIQHASACYERARVTLPDAAVSADEAQFLLGSIRESASAWALLIAESVARRNPRRAAAFAQAAALGATPPLTGRPSLADERVAPAGTDGDNAPMTTAQPEITRHIDAKMDALGGRIAMGFVGVIVTILLAAAAGGWSLSGRLTGIEHSVGTLNSTVAELEKAVGDLKSAAIDLRGAVTDLRGALAAMDKQRPEQQSPEQQQSPER
jgi:hypothetical protein